MMPQQLSSGGSLYYGARLGASSGLEGGLRSGVFFAEEGEGPHHTDARPPRRRILYNEPRNPYAEDSSRDATYSHQLLPPRIIYLSLIPPVVAPPPPHAAPQIEEEQEAGRWADRRRSNPSFEECQLRRMLH